MKRLKMKTKSPNKLDLTSLQVKAVQKYCNHKHPSMEKHLHAVLDLNQMLESKSLAILGKSTENLSESYKRMLWQHLIACI